MYFDWLCVVYGDSKLRDGVPGVNRAIVLDRRPEEGPGSGAS